jgi:hypothetical protein
MKNIIEEQADAIPIIRADAIPPPHNRDNLRKRLLQMIVRSEAERRPIQTPANGGSKPAWRSLREVKTTQLNVYDPEDLLSRESTDANLPHRRA